MRSIIWHGLLALSLVLASFSCVAHGIDPSRMVLERSHPIPIDPRTRDADLLVEADFDGNGVQDKAFYVPHDGTYRLVVYMNGGEKIFEISGITDLDNSGIRIVAPGVYRNSCGPGRHHHGQKRCQGRTGEIVLRNPAILHLRYEAFSNIHYWSDGHFHLFHYAD